MNIAETLRQEAIESLFKMNSVSTAWPTWKKEINSLIGSKPYSANDIIEIGNHLYDIFRSTSTAGRGQGSLSGGGAAWEALVCWYLNLCLVGSRAVIIKQSKALVPEPISYALTVKYNNFKSNTEADLVGIVFPDGEDYQHFSGDRKLLKSTLDKLTDRDFSKLEVSVIQCKTNWNDNAQIPMLWDMIYRTKEFIDTGIVVGDKNYSIRDLKRFSYSFATLPSNKLTDFKPTSTSVNRVRNLSGGNYWGLLSQASVAENISEIFARNFYSSNNKGLRATLQSALDDQDISYFNL